ncbi:MAG: hypothetical protein ACYS99_10630 [Planctomycetota bacterium]
MRTLTVALALVLVFSVPAFTAEDPEPDAASLKARVAELERALRKLEAVVEGTAKPVNLARTGLAAVTASSVNGSRSLANGFYGIRNAFDDGQNEINGLKYTYWLTSGEPSPWAEIRFDEPVSIASVFVTGGSSFTARLVYAKGGERDLGPARGGLEVRTVEHGVRAVRLTFEGTGNLRVDEIRVMGHTHRDGPLEVRTPRLILDGRQALIVAKEAYAEWRARELGGSPDAKVEEGEQAFVVTFRRDGVPVLRVVLDRATGETRTEALGRWVPIAEVEDR